jgi:hypothetical protein
MSDFGSSMGKLTVEQHGAGWIVCEDGRRVGGPVRYPFTSREAAQRYADAELAAEAKTMAEGNISLSARARVIRGIDPKVWAKIERIERSLPATTTPRWKPISRPAPLSSWSE